MLATLNDDDLAYVNRFGTWISASGGRVLLREGTVGREAMVIRGGTATVSRDGAVVNRVGPGALIGELALLDNSLRTATVTADGTLELTVLDPREFNSLLASSPDLARRVFTIADDHRRR